MRNPGRFSRKKMRHYYKRIFMVAVLAAVGIGLYFGVQTDGWKNFTKILNGRTVNVNRNTEPERPTPELNDFEDFLGKSSVQQLILRSTEMIDDNQDDFIVRLDRQQKKIQIADALLNIKRDPRANLFGIVSKLKALSSRETINLDHGLSSESGISELQEYSFRNVTSQDTDVRREAQIGKLFSKLSRTLVFSDIENSQSREPLLREFRTLCEQYVDDNEMAATLYSYIERIHVRSSPPVTGEFVKAFSSGYKKSNNDELRSVAETAAKRVLETEFYFVDVFAALAKGKPQAIELLLRQVNTAVERPNISQQGFVSIFKQIQNLARLGLYDDALRTTEILERRLVTRESMQPLMDAIQNKRRLYKQAGRTFQFDAISKLDESEFSVRFPEAAAKAVFFVNSETRNVSNKAIYYIMNIAGKYVASKDFCASVIYFDEGDETGLKEIGEFEKLVKVIDVGIIDVNSESGKEFIREYSIKQLPVLMLLDHDNRIAAVNVAKPDFERRLKILVGK